MGDMEATKAKLPAVGSRVVVLKGNEKTPGEARRRQGFVRGMVGDGSDFVEVVFPGLGGDWGWYAVDGILEVLEDKPCSR